MSYPYFKGDKEFMLDSMRKYLSTVSEMDKLVIKLSAPYLRERELQVLDAGCGIGQLISLLHRAHPDSYFLGVDQTSHVIKEAEKHFVDDHISFEIGDVLELPKKYPKKFDVTISRAVISWLPYYEEFMRSLVAVTTKTVFVSSLFYEGDIDFITQVREFQKEAGKKSFSEYRNVYSLPRFKKYMRSLGAKKVSVTDFNIAIDIPKENPEVLGTYTEMLTSGKRLQISGAVVMSWKWVRIDL